MKANRITRITLKSPALAKGSSRKLTSTKIKPNRRPTIGRKSRIVRLRPWNAVSSRGGGRESKTAGRRRKHSQQFFLYTGGIEGGHFTEDFCGGFYQTH